jgi:hypothetical protein
MRTAIRTIAPLLAGVLLCGAAVAQQGYGNGPQQGYPAQQGYNQGPPPQGGPGGWDAPPREFRGAQLKGFQDGRYGAEQDVKNHRRPNVNNRDEFRHPPVPGFDRRSYREGFRRGYDVAMRHLLGGPGGPR